MKDFHLILSDEECFRLEWIANSLGKSTSEVLRSLIPNLQPPEPKEIVEENQIIGANLNDLIAVRENLDEAKLYDNLKKLINKSWASTLAKEIKKQILDNKKDKARFLNVNTYKRLSRWLHPYRQTEREKYVQPIAEEISKELFGRIIDRINN